jgi:methionine sulfoxide reductase heme-binding subunit
MTGDPIHQAFWFASRAFGITAMILLAISVGLGLAMSGRLVRRPGLQPKLRRFHESATLVTLGLIVVHAGLLLFDSYLRPGLVGITLPFTLSYRPLFTGIGVIAGWLAAVLGLSFYARRKIGVKRWRFMHRFTIVVYFLVLGHVAGAGTDARGPWMIAVLTSLTAPIIFAFTYRMLPSGRAAPRAGVHPRSARSALRITARSIASWKSAPATGGR